MKRIAIVASGWHYPYTFYEALAKQQIPKGWRFDLFVVSHRDPSCAEKKVFDTTTRRGRLDSILYKKVITKQEIEDFGFKYIEKPNTVGDWGNTNQWLEDHDYMKYDLFLFTHDDNLITRDDLLLAVTDVYKEDWLIMSNSVGMPQGSIRGSFEFFKKEMLDILGGKFDMSEVTLDRTGITENPKDWSELYDWNATVYPLTKLIHEKGLEDKISVMSPFYRVSLYCIEGERGLISSTHGENTQYEEAGLDALEKSGDI